MMEKKTYIFFATAITTVSGATLYYQNKRKYLESLGWSVLVFSFVDGFPGLKSLEDYGSLIIPQLKFFPFFYSQRRQKEIFEILLDKIPTSEEYVIETNHPLSAPWAEMLAKELQCKHFVFSLNESVNSFGKVFFEFLKFKLKRGELVGIKKQTIPMMLGEKNENTTSQVEPLSVLPNHSIVNVADVFFDETVILPNRINVLHIGRPDKNYFLPIMGDFREYAKANQQMFFNLIVVGFEPHSIKLLKRMFRCCANVNLVLMGNLFPIPEKLISLADVGIAASGSASLMKKFGICSISVDVNDFKPIGILGFNTSHNLYRTETEPPIELAKLLDMVLKERNPKSCFFLPDSYGADEDYSSHFNFLSKSEMTKDYFVFPRSDWKTKFVVFVGMFVGLDFCNNILKIVRKVLK